MEDSGFYASINGDREYTDDFLADMIAALVSTGVYDGEMCVSPAGNAMSIIIPAGRLWIKGRYYHNDTPITMKTNNADGTFARYAAVVARQDKNIRKTKVMLIDGIPASSPLKPAPVRTNEIYDIVLAYLHIKAGAIKIELKDIEDTRMNAELCGITTGIVSQVDATTLFLRLQADIEGIEQGSEVMLKTVYGGRQVDSVKKADALTTTLAVSSGGTGVTTLSALKAALALDRASNVPDAEKSVKSAAVCTGNAETATNATSHIGNTDNPHGVTKAQIGLGNADNTADNIKHVSYADTAGRASSAGSADSAGTATTAGRADSANAATDGRMMFNHSYIKASGQQMDFFVDNEYYKVRYGVSQTQGWALYPFAQEMPSTIEKASLMLLGTQACPWLGVYSRDGLVQTSDAREKHNIKPLDSRYIDFIMALKPSEFIMNGNEKVSLGLIAQDVEKALKDVGFDDGVYQLLHKPIGKGGRYALNNIDFIAPLLATVQAQQKQIDQLTARITALESK